MSILMFLLWCLWNILQLAATTLIIFVLASIVYYACCHIILTLGGYE